MIYRFISVLIFIFVIITIYYLVLCHLDDGPIGEKGDNGDIGDIGPTGRQGVKGINGERGPIGIRGEPNLNSKNGSDGDFGKRGIKGDQGERGERGVDGDRGLKGSMGDSGIPGESGIQGDKGVKGKSGNDNILKFILLDGSNYENEQEIETEGSTAFNDYIRPKPGQIYSPNDFNVKFGRGIPLISTNKNGSWPNFVTGFKLKGESITNDRAKTFYTNIKVIDPLKK